MDNAKKNSLLLVDDDILNLKSLTQILQPEYTIYTSKDGQGAIEMAEQTMPDMILLDIMMQGMDGYEVLNVLKSSPKTRHIPVIFITGLSNTEDEEKGLSLGTVDYITKPFTPTIVKLRVRNQIQIINQIKAIERMSVTDQLTEIPNRRSFDSRLREEWGRSIREKLPISILMIDVDKFKGYNDTYGHLQGDALLQVIAKIFVQSLKRPTDLAARWGGEEFAVLLPNTELNGALDVAEQIRSNVECADILLKDGTVSKTTISIGFNTHLPALGDSVDTFVSKADEALYNAKRTGRNKVCSCVE